MKQKTKLVKGQRIKVDDKGRVIIGKMIKDVYYKIVSINNPKFLAITDCKDRDLRPAEVGESIRVDHYKNTDPVSGFENLMLFIFRNNSPNYCRYFDTPEELEQTIENVELVLDKDWANKRINTLLAEVQQYRQDYLIEAQDK